MKYKPVIGLEVHIEQSTKSKMFCGCPAKHFGVEPNTHVCPVCLGLPGALPYANQVAIKNTLMLGKALGLKIAQNAKFDRKHYFYPDLPKGYQISQYDKPLCRNGKFQIPSSKTQIRIKRLHLEEDTAKLVHRRVNGKKASLIDFNRSGVPLMEMVTEPDFDSAQEVVAFLREVQLLVRYLGISDADMEKGSMRLEANVSVAKITNDKPQTSDLPDYKVELKNINSFKFLQKAIEYEVQRQTESLKAGQKLIQETRGYDENTGKTFSQRTKEEAADYRYFPEPDLTEIRVGRLEISDIPELPDQKREKYSKLGLSEHYTDTLVSDPLRADYFEKALELGKKHKLSAKEIAGVMVNQNLDEKYSEPAGLIRKLVEINKKEYASSSEVKEAAKRVINDNPKAVSDYHNGQAQVIGFLIGQVQKVLKGKGDPKLIRKTMIKNLQK